jgi:hypothetical protein
MASHQCPDYHKIRMDLGGSAHHVPLKAKRWGVSTLHSMLGDATVQENRKKGKRGGKNSLRRRFYDVRY